MANGTRQGRTHVSFLALDFGSSLECCLVWPFIIIPPLSTGAGRPPKSERETAMKRPID